MPVDRCRPKALWIEGDKDMTPDFSLILFELSKRICCCRAEAGKGRIWCNRCLAMANLTQAEDYLNRAVKILEVAAAHYKWIKQGGPNPSVPVLTQYKNAFDFMETFRTAPLLSSAQSCTIEDEQKK
jgi:hypothetical protein